MAVLPCRKSAWYPIHNVSPPFWFYLYIIPSGGLQYEMIHICVLTRIHIIWVSVRKSLDLPPPTQEGWYRECNMWHVFVNVTIRWGLVFGSACAEILLVALFGNESPYSGTLCECGNVSCPWHKHTGVSCRATKALFDCALPYRSFARWVQIFKVKECQLLVYTTLDVLHPFTQTCQWP
jgi:hypothetical protein